MDMGEFYRSLCLLEKSDFYVRGYTEALALYTGVRVVPDISYISGLSEDHRRYFISVGFPCYFIPIINRLNSCFGYVLKGREKKTPRNCTNFLLPGTDGVYENDIVVLVEGIKDSYILRKIGLKAIPMLTSNPSEALLWWFRSHNNKVLFIPDNDMYLQRSVDNFVKKAKNVKLEYYIHKIDGVKDLGEVFDSIESKSIVLDNTRAILRTIREIS